ncbi:MAG TPA: hypothetical protein VMT91_11730, partial [Anaerolineales bacterium]|nr:hypothetical protein [Anaerolineales bacterium]
MSFEDLLAQGIAAVKAGQKTQARQFLDAAIRAAPDDIRGWGWFYNVCDNDQERIRCLKEILRIEPGNERAKQKYNELIGLGFQSSEISPRLIQVNDQIKIKSHQGINNKGKISVTEWIIIGVLGGGALLTITVIGILFLFKNFISPMTEIPTYTLLAPTYQIPSPTNQVANIPSFPSRNIPTLGAIPTIAIPTLPPFPTFIPFPTEVVDTLQPTVTAAPPFTPQTQQLGPIHDTERDTDFSLEVTVKDTKWLTSDGFETPKDGDIYLIVYLMAVNLGPGSIQSIGPSDFQIL